jgi:hypothetical protein
VKIGSQGKQLGHALFANAYVSLGYSLISSKPLHIHGTAISFQDHSLSHDGAPYRCGSCENAGDKPSMNFHPYPALCLYPGFSLQHSQPTAAINSDYHAGNLSTRATARNRFLAFFRITFITAKK